MGWRIILQPNRKFARFSEVVDNFTHGDMTMDEAIALCESYGCTPVEAALKVWRAVEHPRRWREALHIICVRHGPVHATFLAAAFSRRR